MIPSLLMIKRLFILFALLFAGCDNTAEYLGDWDDGLPGVPNKTETFDLSNNYYGIESKDYFFIDINNDGALDTIIRGRFVTGTAHAYTFYQIDLSNGKRIAEFQTHEAADCILRAYKFSLNPFMIVSAARLDIGETYCDPSAAKISVFEIQNDELLKSHEFEAGNVADVRVLLSTKTKGAQKCTE